MEELTARVNALCDEKGYNCAQAVFALACGEESADQKAVLQALRAFGGGLATGRICGCVTGGSAALSAGVDEQDKPGKQECRRLTKALVNQFEEMFGCSECSILKKPADGSAPVPCRELMAKTVLLCRGLQGE
ncbi:C-GCAxxG-C-C family protein [Clostridia bacterium OttesenSCG-928-O13]|nr:C-GCAxxG-C-C family protein [Clostridia bacterium OttesenSCG-928-O13]